MARGEVNLLKAQEAIKQALEMDVSWSPDERLLVWHDPNMPPLEDLGLDDMGDVRDYLMGVRLKLIEAMHYLGETPNKVERHG